MKLCVVLFHLHLAVIAAQEQITCDIPNVKLMEPTSLTCKFPGDISASKKDFAVVHMNSTEKPVLDCLWTDGKLVCFPRPGYEFNLTVSNTLTISIPRVFSNMSGEYYCKMSDSGADDIKPCKLDIKQGDRSKLTGADSNDSKTENDVTALAVGVAVGLFAVIVIVVTVVVLVLKFRRGPTKRTPSPEGGETPLTLIRDKKGKMTANFQEHLNSKVKDMFPNIQDSCYFVPPVYFNKSRCTKQPVAGQDVYISDLPDPADFRHDEAMQHVIYCLRHVAERGREQMFCLTQFQYDDYLSIPGQYYRQHCLPSPADLKQEDKSNGCFDFLIIHRHHGVIVGVVKVIRDEAVKSGDDKEHDMSVTGEGDKEHDSMIADEDDNETDKMLTNTGDKKDSTVVEEVAAATQRLTKASCNVQHLMSDCQHFPEVRKVLVFFNITESTLQSLLFSSEKDVKDSSGFQDFKDCWSVCLGQLSHHNLLTEVDNNSLRQFEKLWEWVNRTSSSNTFRMDDELYMNMIARFCGPATMSVLSIQNDCDTYQLPKTLDQAVSLTGKLFERFPLHPDMTELLQNPLVFLAGPPGTGKTRMLVLAGSKYLHDGHVVHIISTSPGGYAVARKLQQAIMSTSHSESNMLLLTACDLEDEKSVSSVLDSIGRISDEKPVLVIADEINFQRKRGGKRLMGGSTNIQRRKNVKSFIKNFQLRFSHLYLWSAGCTDEVLSSEVPGLRQEPLTEAVSVPPVVLREVFKENCLYGVEQYTANRYPLPTDGPPIKHLYHQGQGHVLEHPPHDCKLCGKEIASFLKNTLRITSVDMSDKDDKSQDSNNVSSPRHPASCRYGDVLLLFESDVQKDTPIVKSLLSEDIQVHVVNNPAVAVPEDDKNTVLVAQAGHLLGLKRKVVVFVEGSTDSKDASRSWNRLRCYTSCTSQLVLVHATKP